VSDDDWSARMTDRQLCSALVRIRHSGNIDPSDVDAFAKTVEHLLMRRGGPGCKDLGPDPS